MYGAWIQGHVTYFEKNVICSTIDMSRLLTCSICKTLLRTQSQLYNHVRRVHQTTVKVKFQSGEIKEISRQVDGTFICICGKVFKHPGSLHGHAKRCSSTTLNEDIELCDTVESYSMESESENEIRGLENPNDCLGTH